MIKMGVLSVRLDEELEQQLEYLMKQRKIIDKSAYIRQLLNKSIKDDLITFLCEEVKEKRVSAWKAAETAQISLRAFHRELSKREITTYAESAFEEDLKFILG
jgi:predicted HTH domain antitoxin